MWRVTPVAAQLSCAPTSRSFSRADIVALGQAGKPWEFLAIAARALDVAPGDAGIRFLVVANLSRLALPTLALAQVETLPPEIRSDPAVAALERDLRSAPPDRIAPATLLSTFEANFAALRGRGVLVDVNPAPWVAALDAWVVCRAKGGSVVRAPSHTSPLSAWIGLSDTRSAAAKAVAGLPQTKDGFPAPVVLDGADPPWALMECVRTRRATATGYHPPLLVVDEDTSAVFWSLTVDDLREAIAQERASFFFGPGAAERFERSLKERLDTQVSGFCIPVSPGGSVALRSAFQRACDAQQALTDSLSTQVNAIYAGRDRAWWAARYSAAMTANSGARTPARPLRVLIPTCRYSTFIKHSSADLAAAFRAAGFEAEVMIEPNDHSRFSCPAYLRRFAEFQPDLVVLINYTRATLNGTGAPVVPLNVPFVCWIQDAMPHLFDASVGARHTDLDFVIGHTFPELFERHGYPRERSLRCGIAADPRKFEAGAPGVLDISRYECEIAYVSNHSEPPEVLRDRLRKPFADALGGPALERIVDRLTDRIEKSIDRVPRGGEYVTFEQMTREAVDEAAVTKPDDGMIELMARQFAEPYADRLMRHQTLAWAAEIAERRGWRLKVYGRGWDSHPLLERFAAGELAHGTELGAAYRAATVHLHVTAHTLVHQRLFECLLSGGFPLCRLHQAELAQIYWWMMHEATATSIPCSGSEWPRSTRKLACFADSPGLMRWASLMQRLGVFDHVFAEVSGQRCGALLRERVFEPGNRYPISKPELSCATWHLAEQAEHFYHSPQSLEERVETALHRPSLRAALVERGAASARATRVYDTVVRELLALVSGSLGAGGAGAGNSVAINGTPSRSQ